MQPRLLETVPAARLRRLVAVPALAVAGLALAACGGDGPAGSSGSQTTATFNVTAQAALAQGTTNASVVVTPSYALASGTSAALGPVTKSISGGTAQTFSYDVNLAPCLGANGACVVSAAVTLQAGGRTLDSTFVGPFTVKGGDTFTAIVSFVEVASVQVTREGGAAVGAQPVALLLGQTLDLAATAVGASGAALTRTVGWTSSSAAVATVDANGVVTPVGFGTAKITAAAGGREAAVDVKVQPTLAVLLAGDGVGSVTSTAPAGVSCTAAGAAGCTAAFDLGTSVTLAAAPDGNSTFAGWDGACSGTGACTVALDQARAVTAKFARRRVALTVTVANVGGGDVLVTGGNVAPTTACAAASCAYTVDAGTAVNLTARPTTANVAGVWSGACSGSAAQACGRVFTADAAVGVTFAPRPILDTVSVTATTASAGGPFGGSLQVSGFVNGQPTASQLSFVLSTGTPSPVNGLAFDPSSPVTVRFQPDATSRFTAWGGICAAAGANTTVDQTGISTCIFTSVRDSRATITLDPR